MTDVSIERPRPPGELARQAAALAIALLAPFGAAAALALRGNRIPAPSAALALVITVMAVAVVSGRRYHAIFAAATAAIGFDYFHTRPYHSLTISRSEDIQTAVLLMVSAAIVGELAAWGRRHRDDAAECADDLAGVAGIHDMLAAPGPPDDAVFAVARELCELLALSDCRYDPHADSQSMAVLEPSGDVALGTVRWSGPAVPLPNAQIAVPVRWHGDQFGCFVLAPAPGPPIPLRRRQAALALVGSVAPALAAVSRT